MLSLTALILIYATIIVPDNYKTIQEAVNNASQDDTIIVGEGNYKENISVTRPVSITSRKGPDYTTVRASVPGEPVFKVSNADHVKISGFTATGSILSGIYLYKSNNGTITDNKTVKNGSGIVLYSSSNNVLTGNSADLNEKYGIYIESSSDRNTLEKNSASSNSDNGIFLSSSSFNNLTDNSVNHNTWNGVLLWDSSNNTIGGNRIWRNRFGIVVSGGGNNTFINNSTWSNIYIIMPLILAYIGILSYLVQRRVLRTIYRV